MSANIYVPPLRLEIRDKTEEGDAPWFVFDYAQTAGQAADKLTRHKIAADCETRVSPNESISIAAAAAPVFQDTAETKQLIEQLQTESLANRREINSLTTELGKFKKMKTTPVPTGSPTAAIDALTGETPLPFGVGDLVRDVHTGVAVRVTELNPKSKMGNPRPGFAWENMTTRPGEKDHTGWCPIASVGCFVKIKEGDPLKIEPTGSESPSPVLKSEAVTLTAPSSSTVAISPVGEVAVNPIAAPAKAVAPTAVAKRTAAPRAPRTPHKRPTAKKSAAKRKK